MPTQLVGLEAAEAAFKQNQMCLEMYGFLCGPHLGDGAFRTVFEYAPDTSKVIKLEMGEQSFHNVQEWTVWHRVKDCPGVRKWFAPVLHISPCGSVLLMERADDVLSVDLPELVPAFLTDLAPRNWGKFKGRPVCRDYGSHLLYKVGMSQKMRRAKWRTKATPQPG